MFNCHVKGSKEFRGQRLRKDKWYMTTYSQFSEPIGKIFDYQVADYTKKHLSFFDRFNIRKVTAAVLTSHAIMSNSCDEPNLKNGKWKYFKDC